MEYQRAIQMTDPTIWSHDVNEQNRQVPGFYRDILMVQGPGSRVLGKALVWAVKE